MTKEVKRFVIFNLLRQHGISKRDADTIARRLVELGLL